MGLAVAAEAEEDLEADSEAEAVQEEVHEEDSEVESEVSEVGKLGSDLTKIAMKKVRKNRQE